MDKHTKFQYFLIIVGFIALSVQIWMQGEILEDLITKMEAVRELLFRFS